MSLKELTKTKHADAERCAFSQKLLSGELSEYDYAKYLVQMHHVYSALENSAKAFKLLENLKGIERANAINEDITELVGDDHGIEYLNATKFYHEYLRNLIVNPEGKKKVLAHLYVRHMGDLYGGQMIAQKVPGSGLFYKFENRKELIDSIRQLLTDDLAEEAIFAFDQNISIMKALLNE